MSEKDSANLFAILDSCLKIKEFTFDINTADAFYEDSKTFDAVLMNFIVIGEAVVKIGPEIKENEKQIPWSKIKGFRNFVAHDYFGVDAEEVWQIVKQLPRLSEEIRAILDRQ